MKVEGWKLKALERPEVEKKEDEWHRDEHRLAHQAEGKKKKSQEIPRQG